MAKSKKIKKHRKFWLVVKILILVILLTVLGGGLFLYLKYGDEVIGMQQEAKELVAQSTEDTFRSSETTIAYTKKGKQLAVLKGDKDAYYLTIDKIPKYVQDAFLVTEDKKFYQHDGIDMKGIFRAAVALIKNNGEKKQGASTITQQLARGVFLNTDKTYERKIKEIFIAGNWRKIFKNKNFRVLLKLRIFCQWILWNRGGSQRVFQQELSGFVSGPDLLPVFDP